MVDLVISPEHSVVIPCGDVLLDGLLHVPHRAKGIVIFAHGSGSSRLSPRNQYIANELLQENFSTLLFDLLTQAEDTIDSKTMEFRFDIPFLSKRLITVTEWVINHSKLQRLPIGYFGASTGGGAALMAATVMPTYVRAIVSRGGRPDLAGFVLPEVKAATLLIVGGDDEVVIELNKKAYSQLQCIKKMEIIPNATHLFEEPGKLEEVSRLAMLWFQKYL
jgi:dienelactone hydrolase